MEGQMVGWLIGAVVLIIPLWKILSRVGAKPYLALLASFPGLGFLVVLFIIAYARWPAVEGAAAADGASPGDQRPDGNGGG